jgi:hypothetical protein
MLMGANMQFPVKSSDPAMTTRMSPTGKTAPAENLNKARWKSDPPNLSIRGGDAAIGEPSSNNLAQQGSEGDIGSGQEAQHQELLQVMLHLVHPAAIAALVISAGTLNAIYSLHDGIS